MTYTELLTDYAARADRLRREINSTANLKDCPFVAGHDMMLSVQRLDDTAKSLTRIAKYNGMGEEIDITKGTYEK